MFRGEYDSDWNDENDRNNNWLQEREYEWWWMIWIKWWLYINGHLGEKWIERTIGL